jgi:hypothetical protein
MTRPKYYDIGRYMFLVYLIVLYLSYYNYYHYHVIVV